MKFGKMLVQLAFQVLVFLFTGTSFNLIGKLIVAPSAQGLLAVCIVVLISRACLIKISEKDPTNRIFGIDLPLTIKQIIPLGMGCALGMLAISASMR